MFVIRIMFFRLLESPKFLLSHNRKQEALFVFQEIARINGNEVEINLNNLSSSKHPLSLDRSSNSIISTQRFSSKLNDLKYLFNKNWITTTIIVWSMWGVLSFGHVMFSLYFPKYLETLGKEENREHINGGEAIREGLKGFVIYTVWGILGAIMASYLVESFLGRKGTMIIAATGVSLSLFLFTYFHDHY